MATRDEWVREKRRMNEVRMDTLFAPDYDAHWGAIAPTHRRMLEQFLALLPPDGVVLDAACGTGKYWQIITETGRGVRGIDQSSGMLANARRKYPEIPTRKLGLQELNDVALYDGVICMDAMENVFPEDWPLVLRNFHRAQAWRVSLSDGGERGPGRDRDCLYSGSAIGIPCDFGRVGT